MRPDECRNAAAALPATVGLSWVPLTKKQQPFKTSSVAGGASDLLGWALSTFQCCRGANAADWNPCHCSGRRTLWAGKGEGQLSSDVTAPQLRPEGGPNRVAPPEPFADHR